MSRDCAIALQPGQQEQNSVSKEKKKNEFCDQGSKLILALTLLIEVALNLFPFLLCNFQQTKEKDD